MKYRYKVVPVNRRSLAPAFEPGELQAQFEVDINEMHRTLESVNPRSGLPALVLTDRADQQALVQTLATMLSEMFGADVYFQPSDSNERAGWQKQPNLWRPNAKKLDHR